jgi:hypothetical protein
MSHLLIQYTTTDGLTVRNRNGRTLQREIFEGINGAGDFKGRFGDFCEKLEISSQTSA